MCLAEGWSVSEVKAPGPGFAQLPSSSTLAEFSPPALPHNLSMVMQDADHLALPAMAQCSGRVILPPPPRLCTPRTAGLGGGSHHPHVPQTQMRTHKPEPHVETFSSSSPEQPKACCPTPEPGLPLLCPPPPTGKRPLQLLCGTLSGSSSLLSCFLQMHTGLSPLLCTAMSSTSFRGPEAGDWLTGKRRGKAEEVCVPDVPPRTLLFSRHGPGYPSFLWDTQWVAQLPLSQRPGRDTIS